MHQPGIHLFSIRIRFRTRYIRRSMAKQHSRALYPRSCIIVLINFIIIFEMYVHKKLIYFVRREAEREREHVREKRPKKLGNRADYICACVCVSSYNVHVLYVTSRARIRRKRQIVVITYFILLAARVKPIIKREAEESGNHIRTVYISMQSHEGRFHLRCQLVHKSDARDNSQQPVCTVHRIVRACVRYL